MPFVLPAVKESAVGLKNVFDSVFEGLDELGTAAFKSHGAQVEFSVNL